MNGKMVVARLSVDVERMEFHLAKVLDDKLVNLKEGVAKALEAELTPQRIESEIERAIQKQISDEIDQVIRRAVTRAAYSLGAGRIIAEEAHAAVGRVLARLAELHRQPEAR